MTTDILVRKQFELLVELLKDHSPSAELDAAVLVEFVTNASRIKIIAHPELTISNEQQRVLSELVKRRIAGEPIAYLVGEKEFWGREFLVSPAVLIPRPETELIIERSLLFVKNMKRRLKVLDLGTGSGCLVVTLAAELTNLQVEAEYLAIDKSSQALAIAQNNAERLNLDKHIRFVQSDWFNQIDSNECFDLIVANPPYIQEGSHEVSRGTFFEPQSALYASNAGMADLEILVPESVRRLHKGGMALFEFGADQGMLIRGLVSSLSIARFEIYKDLAGHDRVLEVEK